MTTEQQNQTRDNIKKLMEEQGLSQPKLSEKAGYPNRGSSLIFYVVRKF